MVSEAVLSCWTFLMPDLQADISAELCVPCCGHCNVRELVQLRPVSYYK